MKKAKKLTPEQIAFQKQKTIEKFKNFNTSYFGKNTPQSIGICFNAKQVKYSIFAFYENEILVDSFGVNFMIEKIKFENFVLENTIEIQVPFEVLA